MILQALPIHDNGKIVLRAYDPATEEDKDLPLDDDAKKAARKAA